MFKTLLQVLRQKNLMIQALELTEEAMDKADEITHAAVSALLDNQEPTIDIYAIDRRINEAEIRVRRLILEHLAINASTDLTPALIVTSTIIDIERVGDYAKNVYELAQRYPRAFPDEGLFGDIRSRAKDVLEMFDMVQRSLADGDVELASQVMARHRETGGKLESIIERLQLENGITTRDAVTLALASRYLKRISAHLSNLASSVVNPFDRIGFRPGGSPPTDAD